MIIFAWNIRSLGSSNKRRELRNIIRRCKCDFLIICETKADSFSPALLRSIGGGRLNYWDFLPSQGNVSGILIGWDASLASKMNMHIGSYSLSIHFQNLSNSFNWWLTRVYGPCSPTKKMQFLDEL